jgi:hypothetical protein
VRPLFLLAAVALLAVAPARAGAPPPVNSSAMSSDARTGEILASSHAHDRLPIASITKRMTVLTAINTTGSRRRHRRSSARPRSAKSVDRALDPNQLTVSDLIAARSSGQRRGRRTRALGGADFPSFAHDALSGGGARAARHPLCPSGRPPTRGEYRAQPTSRRSRGVLSGHGLFGRPSAGNRIQMRWTDAPYVDDPCLLDAPTLARQDGAYERGGPVPGGRRPRSGVTVYDAARVADPRGANADPSRCSSGALVSSASFCGSDPFPATYAG